MRIIAYMRNNSGGAGDSAAGAVNRPGVAQAAAVRTVSKLAAAAVIIFAATVFVLLARRMNLGPARAVPAFRAFGPKTAAVQIYEYTDFACPACRAAYGRVEELLKLYDGSIAVSLKHYPLTGIHKWSFLAAAYADCAGEQGKFREYSALLFESQELWGKAAERPAVFNDYGERLELDPAVFDACLNAPKTSQRIKLDMAEGDLKSVNSTPTFFINGKRAVGTRQLNDRIFVLSDLLSKER